MKKRKRKVFLRWMRRRLTLVMALISLAFAVLIGTLVYINKTKGAKYEKEVLSQRNYESITVPYRRGDILDCNGTVLATSNKIYSLIIEPANIVKDEDYRKATTDALVKFFGVTKETIDNCLKDEESFYKVVKKHLTYEEVKAFNDFRESDEGDDIIGVWFEEDYTRVYPYKELGCHMLGFVVSGNEGIGGLEGAYNDELNGTNGRTYAYLNDTYNLERITEPATNGYNLVTSIDAEVQKIVQKNAEKLQKKMNPKNISVLVMRPKTCEVLAMYNLHQYDPNDAYSLESTRYQYPKLSDKQFEAKIAKLDDEKRLDSLNKVWRNFVLSDTFEPGSTYKTFVLAGAIEEGVLTGDETYYCDGHQQVADYDIYCSEHDGHGTLDLSQALAYSCNDSFMQIGALMGRTIFAKNQSLFGFGQRTGIDIYGEMDSDSLASLIFDEDKLNEVELATSAFGQGVSVTMIQLGTAFCSVINGGYYYRPSLVRQIKDEHGNVIKNYDNILVRRTISTETSEKMCKMLQGVVENGTGWRTAIEGYTIGGKTGTAEKRPRNEGNFILSFIGFAPVENPEVMIYCVVDEPDVPEQDMSGAGTTLFQYIASDLFPYMNIYRTNDVKPEDIKKVDDPVSPVFTEDSPTDNDRDPAGDTDEDDEDTDEDEDKDKEDEETDPDAEQVEGEDGDNTDDGGGEDEDADEDTGGDDGENEDNGGEDDGDDSGGDDTGGEDGGEETGDDTGGE